MPTLHGHVVHTYTFTLLYWIIIIGLPAQLKKIPDSSMRLSNNSSFTTFISDAPVRNLGVTFDPHLSFSNHISNLSHSCFMHIRDRRRIRPMLDFKTASTIATSIVHSKLDYCNSLFLNLDSTQIQRLQLIQTHSHAPSAERPGIIISLLSLNHFTG